MPDSLPVGPQVPVEGFNPTTSFKPPRPSKGEIHYPYSSYDALLPKESLPLPKKDTLQVSPLPKNIASGTFASAGVALPAGDVTIGDAKQPLYVMLPPDILSTAPKPPSIEDSARAESDKKTAPTSKPDKTFNLWAILDRLVATPMARTWTSLQHIDTLESLQHIALSTTPVRFAKAWVSGHRNYLNQSKREFVFVLD